jgi:cytidyltransferase-like protein
LKLEANDMEPDNQIIKKIMSEIYLESLRTGRFGSSLDNDSKSRELFQAIGIPKDVRNRYLEYLSESGMINFQKATVPSLTEKGRKEITVIMAGGSFDIIHPGHIETLKQAKALGDVLVVSVARNDTFEKNKKKQPVHDEKLRLELVASIKYVDAAVLGSHKDIFETVQFLAPDVIALGYDQMHDEKAMVEGAEKKGISVKVIRLRSDNPEIKTSKIVSGPESKERLYRDF